MSINVAYKLKPGLKTALNSNSKLSTVPKLDTGTASIKSSAATTTSSSSSIRASALQALSTTQSRSNIFSSGEYAKYNNFVGGMRNVNPSDYTMYNVGVNLDASIQSGFAPTPRAQQRAENRYNMAFQRYANAMNTGNQNKAAGTMEMISQLATLTGDITKSIVSLKSATNASNASRTSNTANPSTIASTPNSSSNVASADSSKDCEVAINGLKTKQSNVDGQIVKLNDTIKTETDVKANAEKGLADTDKQITAENQNIQRQSGTITKLQSSIAMDKSQLAQLQRQLSSDSNSLANSGIKAQISQLESKIAESEKQLKAAEDSMKASEDNIKNKLEPAKQEYTNTISNSDKAIKDAQNNLARAEADSKNIKNETGEYEKKLDKFENKEANQLNNLRKELADYAKNYKAETDPNKRAEMQKQYAAKAEQYNKLVGESTVSGHSAVGTQLS